MKKKIIWFTGLSGAGKSTLSRGLLPQLQKKFGKSKGGRGGGMYYSSSGFSSGSSGFGGGSSFGGGSFGGGGAGGSW